MMRKLSILSLMFFALLAHGHEGMWVPTLLKSIESQMQSEGLQLSAEDIYSINAGSLKDAIVHFGGGCTSEIISQEGLLLTNHHCGYSQIQSHSSLENDYLKNGFWAMNRSEELKNPGLSATFIIRIEDVSEQILAQQQLGDEAKLAELEKMLIDAAIKESHYEAFIRPFNYGNAYYMIVTETYKDVRLVGAPPSSIGKYGADTDNWVWPRHTGDFSVFRIYSGPDGKPADISDANIPLKPRHSLPIDISGLEEGEFAMIYGFPGRTMRYLPANAVQHVLDVQNPMRISMRDASLSVIDRAMRNSDQNRIQYASKQSRIANAWKKWIGQSKGLKWLDAVEKKKQLESEFAARILKNGTNDTYAETLNALNKAYEQYFPYADARDLFIEFVYYGPEILRLSDRLRKIDEKYDDLEADGKLLDEINKVQKGLASYFKNYDVEVDKDVFKAQLPLFLKYADAQLLPASFEALKGKDKRALDTYIDGLYAKSYFADSDALNSLLEGSPKALKKKVLRDPIYRIKKELFDAYFQHIRVGYAKSDEAIQRTMQQWTKGLVEAFPEKNFWPDANSTLRLSYGKVEGSEPRDGVEYEPFTTLDGVIAKYEPGNYEFDLPAKLLQLHADKDYGQYANADGSMPVCFTSSLHTTGGNSGSPIINGRGELIGLNFDRSWESTMSDILFDPEKCRNISVDVRYVLFIIDKFAGAGHLVKEMDLRTDVKEVLPAIPAAE